MDTPDQTAPQTIDPTTPPTPSLTSTASHRKLYVIIAVVSTLVALFGAFWYVSNSKKPTLIYPDNKLARISEAPEDESKKDEFAGWKTYTNEKYGFTFKYPSTWKTDSSDPDKIITIRDDYHKVSGDFESGTASIIFRQSNDSLEDAISNATGVDKKEEARLGGNPATRLTGMEGIAGSMHFISLITNHNGKTSTISLYSQDSQLFPTFTTEFEKILSTFKFTDQNQSVDTTNWQTYSHVTYDFSFKYPSDYVVEDMGLKPRTDDNNTYSGELRIVKQDLQKLGQTPEIDLEIAKTNRALDEFASSIMGTDAKSEILNLENGITALKLVNNKPSSSAPNPNQTAYYFKYKDYVYFLTANYTIGDQTEFERETKNLDGIIKTFTWK